MTPLQLFGYGIAFIGVMYYNYQKIQVRSTGWEALPWGEGGRRCGCQQVRAVQGLALRGGSQRCR